MKNLAKAFIYFIMFTLGLAVLAVIMAFYTTIFMIVMDYIHG